MLQVEEEYYSKVRSGEEDINKHWRCSWAAIFFYFLSIFRCTRYDHVKHYPLQHKAIIIQINEILSQPYFFIFLIATPIPQSLTSVKYFSTSYRSASMLWSTIYGPGWTLVSWNTTTPVDDNSCVYFQSSTNQSAFHKNTLRSLVWYILNFQN